VQRIAAMASATVAGGLAADRIQATGTPPLCPHAHQIHRVWFGMVLSLVPPRLIMAQNNHR